MKIEAHDTTTVILNAEEFAEFAERVRHACSVALGDLLALGMPSPATSTGRLLTDTLLEVEAIQRVLTISAENIQ